MSPREIGGLQGSIEVAGGKLKETGTSHWNYPNTGATNESGFSALPAGYRSLAETYYDIQHVTFYWSASEYDTSLAWSHPLSSDQIYSMSFFLKKVNGLSVRCIKDE